MHRVNFKKRQKLILRVVSYGLLCVLTLVTTAVLLYAALGYRVARNGEVIRSGLLLVDSKPVSAGVFLNGEDKNDETQSRFVLPVGDYKLELKRDKYRGWSKNVEVETSAVENIHYPLLVPETLQPENVAQLPLPDMASQSLDHKRVLTHQRTEALLQLIELDPQKPVVKTLAVPSGFTAGSLQVVEWSLNNRFVLVNQTLADKTVRLLRVDVEKPQESIDITSLFNTTPADPHFRGTEVNSLYGREGSNVRQYEIAQREVKTLISDVVQYAPFGKDTLSFVRRNKKTLEAGILKDGKATIVHKTTYKKGAAWSRYAAYDGAHYLALQLPDEKRVTIYRNPVSAPVLEEQLPYASLPLANVELLNFSDNSQFVLAVSGTQLAVYDLFYDRKFQFSVSKEATEIVWADSHHLLVRSKDGNTQLMDFDGKNRYELLKTSVGTLLFSHDYKTSYRFLKDGSKANLQASAMVVN